MMRNCLKIVLIIFVFLSMGFFNCQAEDKLYTAYNIWKWSGYNNAFINFKGGRKMIPAGTEVKNPPLIFDNQPQSSNQLYPQHVLFKTLPDKKKHRMHFILRFHPGVAIQDYLKKTFTPKSFEELTAGMTETEINAIKNGEIVDGMSKEAVLVSYGYPIERDTPDLDNNTWVYFINSRRRKIVKFNSRGRTGPEIVKTQDSGSESGNQNSDARLEEKLILLQKLLDKGLITQEEYENKKAALLDEL